MFSGASCHQSTVTVLDHDRCLFTAVNFQERWNFPNVTGRIDGKHIRIKCRTKAGSFFTITNNFLSVVLQGVADSEIRFIFIGTGVFGKQSDGGPFPGSTSWKNWNLP